jgi:CspA family cold shock protein
LKGGKNMIGKVKWFDAEKGFGFINRGEGEDIFVHYSQIQEEGYRSLEEGQEVKFELAKTSRGLQARNVVKLAC